MFIKWKPVPTIDKVITSIDVANMQCTVDGREVALLGDLPLKFLRTRCVAEFGVQRGTGLLVGQRLRADKKRGNAPATEHDVRASAAMGLHDVLDLAQWVGLEAPVGAV